MMIDFVNPILQWLNAHPNWAGLVIFIISACESIAVIGTIVPGSIMMTAVGTLAGSGVVPLWLAIFSAILGAIVGDGISYFLGYYFRDSIRHVWPFRNNPEWLAKGEQFFHKHGGKSVFIGRFVGPVRALVPLIAGMLGMKPIRFYIANITSAIGWAPAYMLPGILLGAVSLELPPDIAVHVILMLLLVSLFTIFCIWFVVKLCVLISNQIQYGLNRLWRRLQKARYGKIITVPLKHYDPKRKHGQLVLAFYFIIVTAAFLYLTYDIAKYGAQSFFINNALFHFFRSLRTPAVDNVMIYITMLGDKHVVLPVILIVFAWLVATKRNYLAWQLFLLGILAIGSIEIFKHFTHSLRPWGVHQSPESFSFPSGHTTLSTTFFVGFALLLCQAYPARSKLFIFCALVIAALVSISRLYLGAHWFTDVLAGWLLSTALLLFITISYNRKKHTPIKFSRFISVTALAFLVIYLLASWHYFEKYKQSSAMVNYPAYTININNWWQQSDRHLPLYRVNRFGTGDQVLNIQWVGDLEKITDVLIDNNWEEPPEHDWISILQRITDVQSTQYLPLVSPLHLDKKPVLVLVKNNNENKIIVLRLWDSNIIMQPSQEKLWVGTIDIIPRTYSWLFRKKSAAPVIDSVTLFKKTPKEYDVKMIVLSKVHVRNKHTLPVMLLIKPKS